MNRTAMRCRAGLMPAALLFLFPLATPGGLFAVEFLRGDSNSDGVVSISDSHYLLNFLFRGGEPPECSKASDADDSGGINLTDAVYLLNYLVLGGASPTAPFPAVGPDPTPDTHECGAYGNGSRQPDPVARLALRDAVADAGTHEAVVVVVASHSTPIAGYSGTVVIEGSAIATVPSQPIESMDLTDTLTRGFVAATVEGDRLRFGFLGSLTAEASIPPGEDVPVMEFSVCLASGTPSGTYALTLESGELVDSQTARAIEPVLGSATLTVVSDVPDDAGCKPHSPPDGGGDGGPFCTQPPASRQATYELIGGTAAAGSSVTVPFVTRANAEMQAFAISLDFDESVLQGTEVEIFYDKPDGTDYGFKRFDINNLDENQGSAGVDEGFIVGAAVFSFQRGDQNPPANEDNTILRFHFDVAPDTTADSTELRFIDGGQITGQPVKNILTACGEAWDPETMGSFILINGFVNIIDEITVFTRGDTNGDGDVDITDAQVTLSYLFLGRERPHCFDAADADDDGQLNISDPIATLSFLFQGGPSLPPPNVPGRDPTPDRMTCSVRGP